MIREAVDINTGKVYIFDTADSAPVSSGVASVNGKSGSVILTGEDISVSSSDPSTILSAISTIDSDLSAMGGTVETVSNDLEELGEQVSTIQTDVNTLKASHSYQFLNGTPEALALTADWANLPISSTTKIPATNADFTVNEASNGITCARAGAVHIKACLSLADYLGANIDVSFSVNGTPTTTMQSYEHEAGKFTIENDFYTEVAANDSLAIIVKEPLAQSETLMFLGVSIFIEYL